LPIKGARLDGSCCNPGHINMPSQTAEITAYASTRQKSENVGSGVSSPPALKSYALH
jgi:hypothetical protein